MKSIALLSVTWFVTQAVVSADSPAAPFAWMQLSEERGHLFKMVPPKVRWEDGKVVMEREGFGVAYKLGEDGTLEEVWRLDRFYAFEGHLSDDGRHFAAYGPWGEDLANHSDIAISFFRDGKLLKEYQVRDLIKRPEAIVNSTSHYEWKASIQTTPNGFQDDTFHLVMSDRTSYTFDAETGEIRHTGIDEGAKGRRDIWEEEHREASAQGLKLYEESGLAETLGRRFTFSEIQGMSAPYYGVHFGGAAWGADMMPVEKYPYPAMIEAQFPVVDGKKIEVSLTPGEIESSLAAAFAHPFVSKRFTEGTGKRLRLRITGDRLHWNTGELKEFVKQLDGAEPADGTLRHWGEFILDEGAHDYRSFYLNSDTKEIIREEGSKMPPVLIRMDAEGRTVDGGKR